MKTILWVLIFCCFFECLYAQKQPRYTIEVDDTKEHKAEIDTEEYCQANASRLDFSPRIPCKDTIAATAIVYKKGLENYVDYYSHILKRRIIGYKQEEVLPDTAWLKKHVRHVAFHFDSQYSDLQTDYAREQNAIDSIYFIKEWALFERFLQDYKHIETMSIYLNSNLIIKYLQRAFCLPHGVTQLKKLRHLEIYLDDYRYNDYHSISLPQEILKIKHLNQLELWRGSYYGLEQLSTNKKLKSLFIYADIVSTGFPLWLYDMPNLKYLGLNYCFVDSITGKELDIVTLPKGISKLKKLRSLSLGHFGCGYKITHLPVAELCSIKKLESLSVHSSAFFKNKTQIEQLKKHLKTYYFNGYEN